MADVPRPDEIDPTTPLALEVLVELMRTWRNHWAEVDRIFGDFPDEVKQLVMLRPADPEDALAEARAQFAVLFHPDAISAFVGYLNAALFSIEDLLERDAWPSPPEVDQGLEARVAALELAVEELRAERQPED